MRHRKDEFCCSLKSSCLFSVELDVVGLVVDEAVVSLGGVGVGVGRGRVMECGAGLENGI